MKEVIIILFAVLYSTIALGASKDLDALVKKIAKINEVQHEHVGFGGVPSENYQNFERLKEIATKRDLEVLTDHENATVACYASWGLADASYAGLDRILHKFISNDRGIISFSGCLKSPGNVSSSLYHRYWNRIEAMNRSSDPILYRLDSVVLFSADPPWLIMTRVLENRVYQGAYKTRLAELAFEHNNLQAIFYLSEWYKGEYAERIRKALLAYLKSEEFEKAGTTDYYKTVEELIRYNDPEVKEAIVEKMMSDRQWEREKERFQY